MHYNQISELVMVLAAGNHAIAANPPIVINATGLVFVPENVAAGVGDVLEFHFVDGNHSVVFGDYNHPCEPSSSGGFYSNFLPAPETGENDQVFQVTINDTTPFVYYCSQPSYNHCAAGMVGTVNEADGSTSLAAYKASAAAVVTNVSPKGPAFGGELVANPIAAANGTDDGNSTSTTTTVVTTGTPTSTPTSSGDGATSTPTPSDVANAAASARLDGYVAAGLAGLLALAVV